MASHNSARRLHAPQQNASWYAEVYLPVQVGSIDGTDVVPHDRAVARAESANYVNPTAAHGVTSDPLNTIFVGRLNPETTDVTGESKKYGFIVFEDPRACDDCYRAFSGLPQPSLHLDDRQILVDYERNRVMKGWVPRRLGGGFGGKKGSGQLRFGARDRPFREPFNGPRRDAPPSNKTDPPPRRATRDDAWRQEYLRKTRSASAVPSSDTSKRCRVNEGPYRSSSSSRFGDARTRPSHARSRSRSHSHSLSRAPSTSSRAVQEDDQRRPYDSRDRYAHSGRGHDPAPNVGTENRSSREHSSASGNRPRRDDPTTRRTDYRDDHRRDHHMDDNGREHRDDGGRRVHRRDDYRGAYRDYHERKRESRGQHDHRDRRRD